ncbi:MAG: SMC family ATPase [Saccharospirillaceae bacterium]|nr:SMC family ATPase [Pseudomonadales bacterium]NRB80430.1 SMC family ATPase [Saccharospirillaceae bacterium]
MKPLFLSMQAFGPFADTQTIEFSKLGVNPLFLINGPTGAGKSTVLDAMSFALYGESTGKEREPSSMRCDLSSDDIITEIIFDFILAEKIYRIIRTPAQQVSKKRGGGTTTKAPTVLVYQQDYSGEEVCVDVTLVGCQLLALKGVKEVNEWVNRITGLSSEQFRQVMVLPQGQFRKLLLAESNQREEIFSQLFQTQIYKEIENKLKEQSSQLRRDRTELKAKVAGVLSVTGLDDYVELEENIKDIKPEFKLEKIKLDELQLQKEQSIKLIETANIVVKQFEQLNVKKQELLLLDQQQENNQQNQLIITHAKNAQKLTPVLVKFQQIDLQFNLETNRKTNLLRESEQLETKQKDFNQQVIDVKIKHNSLDGLKKQLNDWNQKQQALQQLTEFKKNVDSTKQQVNELTQNVFKIELDKKNNAQQTSSLTALIKSQQLELQSIPELNAQLERFKRLGAIKRKVVENEKSLAELQLKQIQDNKIFQQYDNEKQQKNTNLKHCELSWFQGQAFELAKQLNVDEACLVCGSLEHPNPAQAGEQQFANKADVEKSRQLLEVANKNLADSQNLINLNNEKIKNHQQLIFDLNQQLTELVTQPIEWFEQQWQQINRQLKQLNVLATSLVDNEKNITVLIAQLSEIEKSLVNTNESRQNIVLEQTKLQSQIEFIEKQIPLEYQDNTKIQFELDRLNKNITDIEQQFKQINEQFQKQQQSIVANQSLLIESTSRIKQLDIQLQQFKYEWESALTSSEFDDIEQYQQAILSDNQLQLMIEKNDSYQQLLHVVRLKIKELKEELKQKEAPDLIKLNTQLDEDSKNITEQTLVFNAINSRLQTLNDVKKQLTSIEKQLKKIDEQYSVVGTLSDVANGTVNKVSLQRYVLSVLLDDVLNEASQRLQIMSKGRFILRRKLDKTKGNKSSGLDLEVEDSYSGARRPANTLSGGESFMAALSLALGLSDVVQSYSGGIKLETLFIDEGFGSLDMESLDLAIQTLIELRKSGRTIGIISHVSELKEQMHQRIDIIPSSSGSRITLVN